MPSTDPNMDLNSGPWDQDLSRDQESDTQPTEPCRCPEALVSFSFSPPPALSFFLRVHTHVRGAEIEGQQPLNSVWGPTLGSISGPWGHYLSRSQEMDTTPTEPPRHPQTLVSNPAFTTYQCETLSKHVNFSWLPFLTCKIGISMGTVPISQSLGENERR